MEEYHKIQSIFKRDDKTKLFIEGQYSVPEFEYLKDNIWVGTEKIDGTNVRVAWEYHFEALRNKLKFGGRSDKAQTQASLIEKLYTIFPSDEKKMKEVFGIDEICACLYGEGCGYRVQKNGWRYISRQPDLNGKLPEFTNKDVDFILFDVFINGWWLRRHDVEEIAEKFDIRVVPIIFEGTIDEAIEIVKNGLPSTYGDFEAEGMVLKPKIPLHTRRGDRVITKLKHKDFVKESK